MPSQIEYADIPSTVTLTNLTDYPQRVAHLVIPRGTIEAGIFTPGELTIDMRAVRGHVRENLWLACLYAHNGNALKIKAS
jgi:hypothetical protein